MLDGWCYFTSIVRAPKATHSPLPPLLLSHHTRAMDRYLGATMFCKECAAESDIFVGECGGCVQAESTETRSTRFVVASTIKQPSRQRGIEAALIPIPTPQHRAWASSTSPYLSIPPNPP